MHRTPPAGSAAKTVIRPQTSDDDLSGSDVEPGGSRKVSYFGEPTVANNRPIHAKHTTFQTANGTSIAHIKGGKLLEMCHSRVQTACLSARDRALPVNGIFIINSGADFLKYTGAFAMSQARNFDAAPRFSDDRTIQMQLGSKPFDVVLCTGFKKIDIPSSNLAAAILADPNIAIVLPDNTIYLKSGRNLKAISDDRINQGLTTLVRITDPTTTALVKTITDNGFAECKELSVVLQRDSSKIYAPFNKISRPVSERIFCEFPPKKGETSATKKDLSYTEIRQYVDSLARANIPGKMIADIQLAFLQGTITDERQIIEMLPDGVNKPFVVNLIHFFTALMFGVEGSRSNMHMVTAAMQLELVSAGKMQYADLFRTDSYGGQMPLAAFGSGGGTFSTMRDKVENHNYSMVTERSPEKAYPTGSLTLQQQHQVPTKMAMVIKNYVRHVYPVETGRDQEMARVEQHIDKAIVYILNKYFGAHLTDV